MSLETDLSEERLETGLLKIRDEINFPEDYLPCNIILRLIHLPTKAHQVLKRDKTTQREH